MENCATNSSLKYQPLLIQQIVLEASTCVITFCLMLSFLIAACQNRLWMKIRLATLLLEHITNPFAHLFVNVVVLVLVLPFRNDLYFLWVMLLIIGSESTSCISGYSLSNPQTAKKMYFLLFVDNLCVGLLIWWYSKGSKFRVHLWALWILITLKTAERCLSFFSARRAYGTNKIDLVSDYMQYEHTLSSPEEVDPATLQGYKYLVHGEKGAKFNISGDYQVRIDLENQRLVTIDKIWRCKTGLLSPGIDILKDLCLSFALFKLLRRSFAHCPAAESEQPKTRDLVFEGILAKGDGIRAFEVVKAELGFLRDLHHTKYPIIFGCGFPTVNFIICLAVLAVMGWLSKVVYHDYHRPPAGELMHYVRNHNVDLDITYIVVGMILAMEVTEFLTYLFSDWAKVMLVCGHVQGSSWLLKHYSLSKMLRFICTPTFSQALCSHIGQHSLLDNSNSSACSSSILGRRPGRGKDQNRRVKVPPEVKMAIATSLRQSQGNLSNGGSSLQRNGVTEYLGWACNYPTLAHTIMVWHIATHYCEMEYDLSQKSVSAPTNEMVQRNKLTANALSQYCAYLLVFVPDLLPISARHDTKLVLDKMVHETRTFMEGAKTERDKYVKMNQVGNNEETVIAFGSRLGRQLGSISLYERWKVLADLWAELLVYLAPTDNPDAHLKKLADGGEFITQVWILLYHAGILKQPSATTNIDV
ncbi:hypothetical protein ZIOFF_002127 [Zingiber officinale]|uniref:DUF4220 domain-containing protein n=1 Tax=Zingiber officinale TaxID=94328 RepID=A0A8J5IKS0_ZINOF|nr:hypothetical protein ZIOFF_002127 [Zingiber officinale]